MVWIVLNNAIALWGNDVIMYLESVFLVLRELMEHGALKIANAQKMAPPFAYIPRVNVFVLPIIMAIGINFKISTSNSCRAINIMSLLYTCKVQYIVFLKKYIVGNKT